MKSITGYKGWMVLAVFLLSACSGNDFKKNPVDVLIRDMTETPIYSIILYDMNVEGTFFKDYEHQYRIIKQSSPDAKPEEVITDWYPVEENFFNQHANDMGMEIAAKSEDGKVSKLVSPPGYSNYVGNPQYGQWQTGANGNSFWAFYGQYAFLSSMLNLATFPIRRSYYDDYRTYRGSGRPYYGPVVSNGRRAYGTGSAYTTAAKPNTRWSSTRNSSSAFRSGNRTSRSGSRYNSSSSMRSRGGGFGK
ncbi:hypothetical protein PZB74_20155 [Porifericola rhodea]|uniref:hypothetical protein n=1 Tax=Porifericola rhodea TaxID=930972 RepID=UPI002666B559|nr:hypothetical protein [Porifericola rhodea]WKN31268.1 hypothetical protein PZB74_20155 [Porifericola rhodea]